MAAGALRPVFGVRLTLGRRHARTDAGGKAVLRVRFSRPGVRLVRARARGYAAAQAALAVRGR
jgi:hypothetical protein